MARSDFVVVILAAGKGTRLRSGLAKVLHRAGGRTLVEHVVRACLPLGASEVVVVVGYQAEDVRAIVEPLGAKTVLQEPQLGTGHALDVARQAIGERAQYALVVPGDAPLVRTATLAEVVHAHRAGRAAATLLSATLADPTSYGRVIRKRDGSVAAVIEEKVTNNEQRAIREINTSVYCFTLEKLRPCLAKLRPENVHRELYLTDAIALLNERGETVLATEAADPSEVLGCNTRAELAEVDRIFRQRKRASLMEAGITIYLPDTVLIDPEVEVGVVVRQHCVVASSRLGKGVIVGPFAHLRDGAELRPGAQVGNYVEVKKSTLEEGVKAMHLSYLGDASVGRNTNVGAGTITCNYDGVRKNPTTIGQRVFVGSGTELVAPVKVGDGAYIAAGSTITEDIPPDALAIARERQMTKPGWAAKRRAEIGAAKSKASSDPPAGSKPRPKPAKSRRKAAAKSKAKAKPARRR